MKERLIVLAKTYPAISRKYESLVCVGGIKEDSYFRRIYPVPWEVFWHKNGFRKKYLIEYELEDDKPSDHRQESRKVKSDTIKELNEVPFSTIKSLLDPKVTSLEKLSRVDHREVSIGVIVPEIIDFIVKPNPHYEKNIKKSEQRTLGGKSTVQTDIIPWTFSYVFKCCNSCPKPHTIMCEDWELYQLYRQCKEYEKKGKYKDEQEVLEKVKLKSFDLMKEKKIMYFIMGTHYRFNTYIVTSLLYPRKDDKF